MARLLGLLAIIGHLSLVIDRTRFGHFCLCLHAFIILIVAGYYFEDKNGPKGPSEVKPEIEK